MKTDEISEISINGIFPYIGIAPNVEYINGQIEQDKSGFILTDETMKTSIDGVYAIGDVRKTLLSSGLLRLLLMVLSVLFMP